MTTRTWLNGSGSWTDPNQWFGNVAPQPDDTALVASGTLMLDGLALGGGSIDLMSESGLAAPLLMISQASFGKGWVIASSGFAAAAMLDTLGVTLFGGTLNADGLDGRFALSAAALGNSPGDFLLLGGSALNVGLGDALVTSGTVISHGSITVSGSSTFDNGGLVSLVGSTMQVESGAALDGSGTIDLGLAGVLDLQAGAQSSAQAISFTDVGGDVQLAAPAQYTGLITGFVAGDLIDLTRTVADAAFYDASSRQLRVVDNGATVATLSVQGPATGALSTVSDGKGGTVIEVPGSDPRATYLLQSADQAMQSDVVRATLTTRAGDPITGAGVKIGIISNSFDGNPGVGAADAANAAALAGYLPLNMATGTAAVTVLIEGASNDDNEGLAMAELVHQVAPGAQLYFASGDGGLSSYANAVTALQQAGCQVIVDDLTYDNEPFFQNAGPLDQAIASAVAGGVSYFGAAGNDGAAAYQAAYDPQAETLPDGSRATAEAFSNGAAAQTLTLFGGVLTTLVLEWAAPWTPTGGAAQPLLTATLYDASGTLQTISSTVDDGSGIIHPEEILTFTAPITTQYQLVIQGTVAAGTAFKYVLLGSQNGGSTLAGAIDSPAANAGTLKGHEILPGVNSVGAVDFSMTPAFDSPASATAYYSATGASQLLFDAAGNPLATPITIAGPTLVAPVSAGTSLAGFTPFNGTSAAAPNAAAVAALMLQADPHLTPAQVTAILQQSATNLGLPASEQGAGLINADKAVQMALADAAACYVAGTRIATARGPVAVERIRQGDLVRTASGTLRPVVWLGDRSIDCRRHPRPQDVWPVRVQAHAMAHGQPERDLYLSPDHAVLLDGALIPIRYLVNGASIAQVAVPRVGYWHVELASHDVLLAEGLPAESFLDTGNRAAFRNGGGALLLHPDFSRAVWRARACAPLLLEGTALRQAHARLVARAAALGHCSTRDPALFCVAGRERLSMTVLDGRYHVHLPPGRGMVRLRSRGWVPAHRGEADARLLGVAIAGLALDGVALPPDDRRLCTGWHAPEPDWRWTGGDAAIAVRGARTLSFDVALTGRYWETVARSRPGVSADERCRRA